MNEKKDIKPTHLHWRKTCILCGKLISWCRCDGISPDSGSFKTIKSEMCYKCATGGKKELMAGPLKTKEFYLSAGGIMYYDVDEDEIAARWTNEWTEAGNWMRYKFQPTNEVWTSIILSFYNRAIAVWHETLEAKNMILGLQYDSAHLISQKLEDYQRQNFAGSPGTDEHFINNLLSDSGLG